MEDDQEIGAYMFRRTVPSMHLTPEDVRWMVSFWTSYFICPICVIALFLYILVVVLKYGLM